MLNLLSAMSAFAVMLMNADDGANVANGAAPTEGETPTPVATKRKPVSAELLIETCNSPECNSVADVAKKLGMTANNVHQRRHHLSKAGVKFKAYEGKRGGNRLDLEALKAKGESTLPEGSKVFVAQTREVTPEAPQVPQDGQTEQATQPEQSAELQTA